MAHFIDEARIQAVGGPGGNGCVAFRREKYVDKGGPNGGDGGNGGSVIIQAKANVQTLMNMRGKYRFTAKKGQHGQGKNRTGAGGDDLIIEVPIGTIIKDEDTELILGDLTHKDQKLIVARGGRGGRGNTGFKTSTNQVPRIAEDGEPGQVKNLKLELKIMADVGLVGYPNAGKSTLITHISNAHPEIGAYPFTTLTPQLGVVKISDFEFFVMADIPGIIEGAHEGKGVGLRFLRHIERTRLLLFVIDVFDENIGHTFEILQNELESFSETLMNKPFFVAINKIDTCDEAWLEEKKNEFFEKHKIDKEKVFFISGLKEINLERLKEKLYETVIENPREENEEE